MKATDHGHDVAPKCFGCGLASRYADIGTLNERIDQPHRELVDLLDDLLGLGREIRVADRQRNGRQEAKPVAFSATAIPAASFSDRSAAEASATDANAPFRP